MHEANDRRVSDRYRQVIRGYSLKMSRPDIAYISVVHPLHDHRFVYKQCRGLAENGFSVDYYVQAPQACVINGIKIKPLKSYRYRVMRFLSTFLLAPGIISRKYDAIHLVDPELLPLGILIKIFTRIIVIFDAHEDYVDFMKRKHYLNRLTRSFFSSGIKLILNLSGILLDGFVFADDGTADEFKKIPSDRKSFFYNFPVRSMFSGKQNPWESREYDIVFLGTMSRTSGTFIMLEAVTLLKIKHSALKCLFIGEPGSEIKQQVAEYTDKNNLSSCVNFTGKLPHSDVPDFLQKCKVGLIGLVDIPKFHKNIATKMFEYMASGIPVVSSDLPPERKYIVSGRTGFLIEPENPRAMAEAVDRIISNRELWQYMSQECCTHMAEQGYFAEDEIKKLVLFYKYLLLHRRKLFCAG